MRKIWHNGIIKDETEAKVSIYDSALMFGDMVFEMTRSFQQKQFKLRKHLERLYASMRYVHIDCPYTIDELEEACNKVIEANDAAFNKDDEHRLMINVSRGLLGIYEGIVGVDRGTNVMITDFPLRWTVAGFGRLYDEVVNAVVVNQRAIPARFMEPKVKHRSRMYLQMANIEASRFKGKNNWALLLDDDGYVAEGPGDNFFIIKDNTVITPEGRNVLRGISRCYIFELCKKHRIKYREANVEYYDLLEADEAFMTGTPFCILPVTSVNGVKIGLEAGLLTKALLGWWGESVGVDIENQIKSWDKTQGEAKSSPYRFGDERA